MSPEPERQRCRQWQHCYPNARLWHWLGLLHPPAAEDGCVKSLALYQLSGSISHSYSLSRNPPSWLQISERCLASTFYITAYRASVITAWLPRMSGICCAQHKTSHPLYKMCVYLVLCIFGHILIHKSTPSCQFLCVFVCSCHIDTCYKGEYWNIQYFRGSFLHNIQKSIIHHENSILKRQILMFSIATFQMCTTTVYQYIQYM